MLLVEGSFCDLHIIHKRSLFLNFQSILMLHLWIIVCITHAALWAAYFGISECWHPVCRNSATISTSNYICKKYFPHQHYVPKGFFWYKSQLFLIIIEITKWSFNQSRSSMRKTVVLRCYKLKRNYSGHNYIVENKLSSTSSPV